MNPTTTELLERIEILEAEVARLKERKRGRRNSKSDHCRLFEETQKELIRLAFSDDPADENNPLLLDLKDMASYNNPPAFPSFVTFINKPKSEEPKLP